ncbi:MAG: hypothetical protein GEU91_02550 [Rhizobiales bacterium]|nr:hypothetical protein [Hyphomicrobiales bacterium]
MEFSIDRNRRIDAAEITEAEWAVRVDLAAAYRLCERHGWGDLTQGHLSARVSGTPNHFLVYPRGRGVQALDVLLVTKE